MKCSRCGVDRPALVWTDPEPWLCAACTAEVREAKGGDVGAGLMPPWLQDGEDAVSVAIRAGACPECGAGSGHKPECVRGLWPPDVKGFYRIRGVWRRAETAALAGEWESRALEAYLQERSIGEQFYLVGPVAAEEAFQEHRKRCGAALKQSAPGAAVGTFGESPAPEDEDTKVERIENPSPGGQTAWPDAGGGALKGSPSPLKCDCGAAAVRGESHAAWCATRKEP